MIFKKALKRFNNRLVISTTYSNVFYEKYIRWQLSSIIEHMLYGKKNWKKVFKFIWSIRLLLFLLILVASGAFLSYEMGSNSREDEIASIKSSISVNHNIIKYKNNTIVEDSLIISNKNKIIDSLSRFKLTRDWLEFKIYRETEMDDFYLNMSRVSDEVLFFMSSQADRYNIPYSIFFRLIDVESGYRFIPNHGGSGAFGYMQIMSATFNSYSRELGLTGGHTRTNNILVGSYMLYKNHNDWINRGYDEHIAWEYALSEYNTGEGNMRIKDVNGKFIGWMIPSYTRKYIADIMKTYNKNI